MINSLLTKLNQSEILKKISAAFILKVIGTLSAFILYIVIAYWMIKSEEEFLMRKYGDVYRTYVERVPRII